MLFNFKASLQKWSHLVTWKETAQITIKIFNYREDLDKRTFGVKLLMIELLRSIKYKY